MHFYVVDFLLKDKMIKNFIPIYVSKIYLFLIIYQNKEGNF